MAESREAVTFAESVYALSKVVHIAKFRNDVSLGLNEHQRKHLRLLDDIALLLVTEPKSDVAAVALERRSSEVHFYYAKNCPATHIDELIAVLKGIGTPTERSEKMLDKVMLVCRAKILSRHSKLLVTIRENKAVDGPYIRGDRHGELHGYFKSNFSDWYAEFTTAAEFLTTFLTVIEKPLPSKSEQLFDILRMAHVIGSYRPELSPDTTAPQRPPELIFIDPMLNQRIRLLGDYYGAVKRIVKHYDLAAERQSEEIKIKIHPAPGTAQLAATMPKDYLTILNRFATERNLPTATYATIAAAYPICTPAPTAGKPLQSVLHSVHAECTLAVYLTSLGRPWTNIEIGCSKGSCWLCEFYLSHTQAGLAFHVRNVHGKLQPGWTMPEGGDAMVEKSLRELVVNEVIEVMHKAHNGTRGDSQPRSESDEDEKKNTEPTPIRRPFWV
ncbi:hypothetical protein Q9L58_010143 [Maublancomyces gigas]|uniref:Uncharacterized protein n=1 Tax=Discina gigas TaxID=1032678 RepID=A0ABR3G4X7_9PEZI